MLPRLTRRQWNNVIIVGCIVFIVALNLPTIIKHVFITEPHQNYPYVLNPTTQPVQITLPAATLYNSSGHWQLANYSETAAMELSQRWRSLVGTELTTKQYEELRPLLQFPQTVEVWYLDVEEPQRITLYQLEQFWLFRSWEDKWLAITIDASYLGL